MATKSKIEWTHSTWNPVRGCTRVSEGCRNCYAERIAARFAKEGDAYDGLATITDVGPRWTNTIKTFPELLDVPLKWKKSRLIFVNSMSDMFHDDVPLNFIHDVFKTMDQAKQHYFQILTKRSVRLLELNSEVHWTKNVWMGVSVENEDNIYRIDHLRQTDAHVKFLSLEPLLGELPNLDLTNIDWVIVGGESGPYARPMKKEWVIDIQRQCNESNVPFFFKQWGGKKKKKDDRVLNGRIWDDLPLAYNEINI